MTDSIARIGRRGRLRILGLVFVFLAFSLFVLGGAYAAPVQAVSYSAEEIAFVQMLNDYRVSNGRDPLLVSDLLSESSDRHNSDMAKYGFFSHYSQNSDWFSANAAPWDRMAACGYGFNTNMGENIAAGYATAAAVVAGWKSSSGHNATMLSDDYKVVGVSLVYAGGTKYNFFWTTDFGGQVDATAHSLGAAPATTTTARPTTTTVKPTTTTARPTTTTDYVPPITTTTTRYVPPSTTTTAPKPTTTTTVAKPTTTTAAKPVTPTTVATSSPQFSDVSSSTLYADSIYLLAAQGVAGGYADGRFGPYDNVTRQQFAKMIILALDQHVSYVSACSFKDVTTQPSPNDPLYPAGYITACASAGITVGKTPDTFGPYDKITRAQLITMVARAASLGNAPSWYQTPFENFSTTHYPWAARAAYAGILDGYAGMGADFNFWALATRGEVCLVLANLIGL